MNIKKTSHTKLIAILIIIGVLLVGAIAYFVYAYNKGNTSTTSPNTQQADPSINAKTGVDPSSGNTSTTTTDKTTNQIPVSTIMSISIDTLSEQNGNVTYAGTVKNPVPGGSCSAVFSSTINRPITLSPQYSNGTCGPDTISAKSFTSLGTWTLTLRYFTNSTQVSATKDINIQ